MHHGIDVMTQRHQDGRFLLRRLVFILLMAAPLAPARAQSGAETILTGLSQGADRDRFEMRLEFLGTPRSKVILLRNPDRIVIDLFDTVSAIQAVDLAPNALVTDVRQGLVAPERFRIIFTLARPALPSTEMQTEGGRTVLSLRFDRADPAGYAAAAATQSLTKPLAGGDASATGGEKREPSFTIVVDPGHGGVDTGAKGAGGTLEKDINLRFALALRDALKKDEHVEVILTREDDRFIPLAERVAIARRATADLFVSMHADSIRYGELRGATVYTLSERASDSLSREVAEGENAADRFAGLDRQDGEPEVVDILADLTRRETDGFSKHFASELTDELGRNNIRLIKNPKRSAGFRVLLAPDVPSVLVEIGYLSNAEDEKLLLTDQWRDDTAGAIAKAVIAFLEGRDRGPKAEGG